MYFLSPRIYYSLYAVVKVLMVGSSGLEPPTSRLSGVRSNQLSYEPLQLPFGSFGGDERVRTAGLLLARQALYQLSYTPTLLRFGAWCFALSHYLFLKVLAPSKPYSIYSRTNAFLKLF